MTKRKRIRGASLTEVLMASSISVGVLLTAITLFIFGMAQWSRGEAHIIAETDSQRGIRMISAELREAMSVIVDADKLGLDYRLPAKDANGSLVVPATWDGISRSIRLQNGQMIVTAGTDTRSICDNVILTDPQSVGGNAPYVIFTAGAGAITRQLTIMLVTRTNEYKSEYSTSRSRETIYLRNIPELTQN